MSVECKTLMLNSQTNLKEDLSLENRKVKVAMTDLEAKLKAAEVEATQHHEKELRNVSEQLKKEQQRATALDTRLAVLRQTEEASRKELEKAKLEAKRLSDNYNNQAGAYAKMTEVCLQLPICFLSIEMLIYLLRTSKSRRRR